jgi:GT2 family glycosyltransferase
VIAFGCPIADEDEYARYGRPSIERLREPDSLVIEKRGYDSIQEPYNEILDEASARDDLEAVVLLHEDTEIREPRLADVIRWHLRDPAFGVLGAIGSRGVRSLDWWHAPQVGHAPIPLIHSDTLEYGQGAQRADMVDGYLMVVSAPVARRVRFDPAGKSDFHGYDVDFCFRVRARGYSVVVDDIEAAHWSRGSLADGRRWGRAAARWRRTWDPSRWPPEWRGSAPYGFFR